MININEIIAEGQEDDLLPAVIELYQSVDDRYKVICYSLYEQLCRFFVYLVRFIKGYKYSPLDSNGIKILLGDDGLLTHARIATAALDSLFDRLPIDRTLAALNKRHKLKMAAHALILYAESVSENIHGDNKENLQYAKIKA